MENKKLNNKIVVGPWKISAENENVVLDLGGNIVADIQSSEDSQLVAAAPDMYEAIESGMDKLVDCLIALEAGDTEGASETITKLIAQYRGVLLKAGV